LKSKCKWVAIASFPGLTRPRTGMAHLMVDWNEISRAESELNEAISIRSDVTKCCGEIHHKVGFAFKTLGDIALLRRK